jgi:hypothetical protein
VFKTLAICLALVTGWHAYHSTKPSTSVKQYAAEQRAGLVQLERRVNYGLRSDTYTAGGLLVKCQSVGNYSLSLISYGEGLCNE